MLFLKKLSIRILLLVITLVVTIPAAGIIAYSGIQYRNNMLAETRRVLFRLADRVASEQQNLATSLEQLVSALVEVPDIKEGDPSKVSPILKELLKLNSMYLNIFTTDKNGNVKAAAISGMGREFNFSDRRYFKGAIRTGRLASGEYVVGRLTGTPVFSLSFPTKDGDDNFSGIISVSLNLERYQQMLSRMRLTSGTDLVILDHHGIILTKEINSKKYVGKQYSAKAFQQMQGWPDSGVNTIKGDGDVERVVAFRKLRLAGEPTPYMYVVAEIPVQIAIADANKALIKNILILASFLVLACIAALLIGKYSIVNRFRRLEEATQLLASGDLHARVINPGAGELGRLGNTFNSMAEELEKREAERLIAEEENKQLTRHLIQAQKMESVGRLTGGVAHDFNNMLTPIIGYAELLQSDLKDDEKLSRIENILNAAMRAKHLVRQLLSFSRKQVLDIETIEINEVINSFQNILRYTIRENIEIKLNLVDGRYGMRADRNQVEQIIINLAINAQDAISGKGVIEIETAPVLLDDEYAEKYEDTSPGRYMMLAVSDDGCGIDIDEQQRIFEPFFTKGIGTGTGLGLATVHGIIKQHGGNIRVQSEPGKGTTFRCYFPIIEDELFVVSSDQTQHKAVNSRKYRILLVEDNRMVRDFVDELLTKRGFETLIAEDPMHALQISSGEKIDLLVTDIVMPYMTGYELHQKMLENYPGLKALYMSGYTNNIDIDLPAESRFIHKPFAATDFIKKVDLMIDSL